MDGRRRIAEPVTDGVRRPAAGTAAFRLAPQSWPRRAARRWLAQLEAMQPPRGTGLIAAAVIVIGAAGYGAARGGHGPAVMDEFAALRDAAANTAGFQITSIALAGGKQVTREEILTTAGVTGRSSLLFLDASAARARLKANPWIAEATVLKLYPGHLRIDLVEREAFALWQKDGKVNVIAHDGTVLETYVARRFLGLPLVVGAGAESKARQFLALLDNYPQLRDQTAASVLVAERRWNIRLKNGIDVKLPEAGVADALDALVRLDRDNKLLTRDIETVDLRLPDRVTVRLGESAAAARDEALRARPARKKAGDA